MTTLSAPVSSGHWTSPHTSPALGNGSYTVVATEPSSLENAPGRSREVSFVVDTSAPTVVMQQPPSPSNNVAPKFSGTVSGKVFGEAVTVYLHEGATAQGVIVGTVKAAVVSGKWTSPSVTALPNGKHTYTAVAAASSTIGNGEGKSAPATFVVNTEPPSVTLTPLPARSNKAAPAFGGTASEGTSVVVSVYRGTSAEGTPVAIAEAKGTGGAWAASALSTELADGVYTAIATEESAIGNGPGTSAPVTFTIDTKSPTVTLNELPTPSSNRVPAFSGTASEASGVTIAIYKGSSAVGTALASLPAEVSGGEWFAQPAETLEFGEYTAVASQPSSIGNTPGQSRPFTFVVAKIPPGVATEAATGVNRTSAALYGAVNPLGAPVSSCSFEIGTTPSYGRSVGCALVSGAPAFPSTAVGFLPVFIRIYGLAPNTTYHYRVVAGSEGGAGVGPDQAFTTLSEPAKIEPTHPPPSGMNGVAGSFATQLPPTGKGARIGALLKNGLFKQRFKAPSPGTAVIKWYYLPPGAKLSSTARAKVKPVLIASGTVAFKAPSTAVMTLRLTPAARRLLKRAKRIALTATCTFTPVHAAPVTTKGRFQLHR